MVKVSHRFPLWRGGPQFGVHDKEVPDKRLQCFYLRSHKFRVADRYQDGRIGHFPEVAAVSTYDAKQSRPALLGEIHGLDQVHADL